MAATTKSVNKVTFLFEAKVKSLQGKWELFLKNDATPYIRKENSMLSDVKILGDDIRKDKLQIKALNEFLTKQGIGYNSASSIYHKLLSLFLKNDKGDNKRGDVSRYAKAILIADAHGVSGKDLTTWLSAQGGIQKVAYPKEAAEKAKARKKEAIEIGTDYFELMEPIGKVAKSRNKDYQAGLVLLVGNIEPDFSINILTTHRNQPMLDTVLEQVGKRDSTKKLIKQVSKKIAQVQIDTDMKKAVDQAVKKSKVPPKTVPTKKTARKTKKQANAE